MAAPKKQQMKEVGPESHESVLYIQCSNETQGPRGRRDGGRGLRQDPC